MWTAGIVGLPNVGKSTLFNIITKSQVEAHNYPFCTIKPNIGNVMVPDDRLHQLKEAVNSKRVVPTIVQFVDIAGIVRGASKGEGLGNTFLGHIRNVDVIVQILRCFEDEDIIHFEGSVDPIRDLETVELELMLADIETIERRLDRLKSKLKSGDKTSKMEVATLNKALVWLGDFKLLKDLELDDTEKSFLQSLNCLSHKKMLYVVNTNDPMTDEDLDKNPHLQSINQRAKERGAEVISICIKLETEIANLDESDKKDFLQELGMQEPALDLLIRTTYNLLGYITFFTAGEKEVRAWNVIRGSDAVEAASKIHTDISRGFIAAEVISWQDLCQCGSFSKAREQGLCRLEGKQYIICDGDVILFRHNT